MLGSLTSKRCKHKSQGLDCDLGMFGLCCLMAFNAHRKALALQAAMPANGKPKDTAFALVEIKES